MVYDKETMDKLDASFELVDLGTGRVVMESVSDAVSGEFLICLPTDAEYALNVSREAYLFYSDHFTLSFILLQYYSIKLVIIQGPVLSEPSLRISSLSTSFLKYLRMVGSELPILLTK